MSEIEKQKTVLAANTLQNFFSQFGSDIYAEVLLDELFRGLMNEEALFVFGEQKQKRDQVNYGSTEQTVSEQQPKRHDRIRSSHGLGEENYPDYP